MLTGKHFFSHHNEMENLLLLEGIKVDNNQIIDFEKYFWNPMESLEF
jgi:methylated-DNA-protein-cysteine methyltransferase-like protein